MATREKATILQHLRGMVLRVDAAGLTDGQLLAEFIWHGVLKAMLLTKVKTVLGVMLVTASLCGAMGLMYQTQAAEQPKETQAAEKNENPRVDKQQRPKGDPHEICGVWRVISAKPCNKEAEDEAADWDDSRWVIRADSVEIREKRSIIGLACNADLLRRQKSLELKLLNKIVAVLYVLDDGALQARVGFYGETGPKTLPIKHPADRVILTLKRESDLKRKAPAHNRKDKEKKADTQQQGKRETKMP